MKICSLYGAGFYYIPGTDTCIKIGGFVRAEENWNAQGSFGPPLGPSTSSYTRSAQTEYTRVRFAVTFDARSQTEYGTLRSYARAGWQWTSGDYQTGGSQGSSSTGSAWNGGAIGSSSTTYYDRAFIQLAGFSEAAVSPVLLVFGAGLVVGNLLGGRWADRSLAPALIGTLVLMTVAMFASGFAFHSQIGAIIAAFMLGAAAFATVAPLQMWVLQQAGGTGQGLASSLNIAAFNLGNALGAWLGGFVITQGLGLAAIPPVAALVPLLALGLAAFAVTLERRTVRAACA